MDDVVEAGKMATSTTVQGYALNVVGSYMDGINAGIRRVLVGSAPVAGLAGTLATQAILSSTLIIPRSQERDSPSGLFLKTEL